jgi:hypothetical protein
MPDVGDPQVYMAGAVSILAEYPQFVMDAVAEPQTGTKLLDDRPTLKQIRKACEHVYAPVLREEYRRRLEREAVADARPPRTAAEQARVNAQLYEYRRSVHGEVFAVGAFAREVKHGYPPSGLFARFEPWYCRWR